MTDITDTLPLLTLRSGVVFPGMVFTMALDTPEAKFAVDAATSAGDRMVLVPQIDGKYASIGVISEIVETSDVGDGSQAVVIQGIERAAIGVAVPSSGNALWVQVEPVPGGVVTATITQLAREYRAVLENILLAKGARRLAERLREVTDPEQISDIAGYSNDLTLEQKLQALESVDLEARLRLVLSFARETLADISLRERIKTDVEDGMEKTQREFLLRRQLEAIRRELGELDGATEEGSPERYRERLAATEVNDKIRASVNREIDKMERTSEQSPEHGWIRTWLDTVLELPWGVTSEDRLDVNEASQILDSDHDGLRDVKDRIIEHLSVRKLQTERGLRAVDRHSGAILALVGPPGVGKTSLGESVARALGRKFVRVSLGGVHDEAEIRGHRRTYVGSQPGRFVRALKEAGTMNPVILLDEIDKVGSDFRGDPAAALLEVLDPAQNHTFADHYLEVELDLSQVLFVATANVIDSIPIALYDRLEVIHLDGYTEAEKVGIARHHLVARQRERAAITSDEVVVTNEALGTIIADYTREAGVRSLERELGRLFRKVATKISSGATTAPVVINRDDVVTWLGRPRFFFETADRTSVPGVATGLAVTGAGGDVLYVEATAIDGGDGLTLTGQLGDVMKESAEIALSYVRSHAEALGIAQSQLRNRRFHLHVPAGAVPKDGPSAGVTMTTAIVSMLTDRAVRPIVGMTGEVTLQGRVLPIGGVKQKVLAAHRAGLREVVLPKRNGPDLEDIPTEIRDEMTFHLADDVADVLRVALAEKSAVGQQAA